jgi:hypothetical protein
MFGRNVSDEVSLVLSVWMTSRDIDDDTLDQQRPHEHPWL